MQLNMHDTHVNKSETSTSAYRFSVTAAALKVTLTERRQTDGVELEWTVPPSGESTEHQLLHIVYWRSSYWPSRNLERSSWEMLTTVS
jgi:hypothetical protein